MPTAAAAAAAAAEPAVAAFFASAAAAPSCNAVMVDATSAVRAAVAVSRAAAHRSRADVEIFSQGLADVARQVTVVIHLKTRGFKGMSSSSRVGRRGRRMR